jgi:hypothetical protein
MFLAKSTLCVMIVAGFFVVSYAMAGGKDPPSDSRFEPLPGSTVYGSEEPEKIFDYLKYHRLISGYTVQVRGNLAEKLSLEDQQVLLDMAIRDPIDMEPITEEYRQGRLHICANRGNMTPVEIAEEWSRIALVWRLKNEDRLRQGLDALSDEGRQVVEDYVAQEIVPNLAQSSPSGGIEDVKRNPEAFMESVELECYVAENGEFPPLSSRNSRSSTDRWTSGASAVFWFRNFSCITPCTIRGNPPPLIFSLLNPEQGEIHDYISANCTNVIHTVAVTSRATTTQKRHNLVVIIQDIPDSNFGNVPPTNFPPFCPIISGTVGVGVP